MLDNSTKKRIDNLRDILVGKIPDPKSQVEQITTGLIYKFMYDMDQEARRMRGKPSFFIRGFKKYSWKNLFDPKLSGADKVQLYSEAIESMYTHRSAPELFREIFKNSFLPFRDPSTLNMFLEEIDEFNYSHSEKLGDAFEYLLSFMGSQGDAGQFRTPRHIIDFIVEIVNPQKSETILDPACGTAGFLISSYKHILKKNTDKKLGDKLTAAAKKKIGSNLVGYDISPDMTRISLVNMYLHQFKTPQIYEYDTLSSEDRWNEYYDVILANPPFFSPKGGVINPHQQFGVQSKRAEVLFVDYIMEHLRPNGRAGIIVPEGIISQTGIAYKKLRKKLVETCLAGVISLPIGVFKPYSGVKTSILILDKANAGIIEDIFFFEIKNDGFSLGDQRTAIDKNDLPTAVSIISKLPKLSDSRDLKIVPRRKILNQKEYSLNFNKYIERKLIASSFPVVKLGHVISLEYGKLLKKENRKPGEYPVFGSNGIVGFHNEYLVEGPCIIIGRQGSAGKVKFSEKSVFPITTTFYVSIKDKGVNIKYLYYALKKLSLETLNFQSGVPGLNRNDIYELEIPLPSIETQKEIIKELEGYQKIINGCRQVIENYEPIINIDPSWKLVKLSKIAALQNGGAFNSKQFNEIDGKPIIRIRDIKKNNTKTFYMGEYSDKFLVQNGDLLVGMDGEFNACIWKGGEGLLNQRVCKLIPNEKILSQFLFRMIQAPLKQIERNTFAVTVKHISSKQIKEIDIPLPSIKIQREIVKELEEHQKIIDGNKKLIEIYTQKIQDRINKVWGE